MTEILPGLAEATGNVAEFTVSEVANAVKRTLEHTFEHVRVRGEVSRPNYHGSGHLYFTLKDENAALDAVCWRGTVSMLRLRVEEGMEVVCTGRISSYPRNSRYQLVVESVELAGRGALLKLLEDRRKKLAAEGLFDEARKKELPFLPEVVGVITSPTGAVIRDILHRLADRFPRHVILWPVPVQGDGAAEKVAAAIAGFNALPEGGRIPRPDVLIVARGGGSLEDLWTFNEEVVVRAAAASEIPLISAIGHETDTTLIDYAADVRAPTPTAAAEMAVPVRAELQASAMDIGRRLFAATSRLLAERRTELAGLARGLPEPQRLLEEAAIRLDNETDRLRNALGNLVRHHRAEVGRLAGALRHPREIHALSAKHVEQIGLRFNQIVRTTVARREERFHAVSAETRLPAAFARLHRDAVARLARGGDLLRSLSYERTLERGFAIVQDDAGATIASAAAASPGSEISIRFRDGAVGATVHSAAPRETSVGGAGRGVPRRKAKSSVDDPQGSLI
jgi:exodeoxyribonuclease VII large subunit